MNYYLILILFIASGSFSQDQISENYIPKEFLSSGIYICKYDVMTPQEMNTLSGSSENYQGYNLVYYRKLNNEITDIVNQYAKKLEITILHERDLSEKRNEKRFVIKPDYSSQDILQTINYSSGWYIFDQTSKTKYASFPSLESLLEILIIINQKYPNGKKANLTEAQLQSLADKSIPKAKVRQEMPVGLKWTLGILCYAAFQTAIIIIPNL